MNDAALTETEKSNLSAMLAELTSAMLDKTQLIWLHDNASYIPSTLGERRVLEAFWTIGTAVSDIEFNKAEDFLAVLGVE